MPRSPLFAGHSLLFAPRFPRFAPFELEGIRREELFEPCEGEGMEGEESFERREGGGTARGELFAPLEAELAALPLPFGWLEEEGMRLEGRGTRPERVPITRGTPGDYLKLQEAPELMALETYSSQPAKLRWLDALKTVLPSRTPSRPTRRYSTMDELHNGSRYGPS